MTDRLAAIRARAEVVTGSKFRHTARLLAREDVPLLFDIVEAAVAVAASQSQCNHGDVVDTVAMDDLLGAIARLEEQT